MLPLEDAVEDTETQRLTREYPVRDTLGRYYDFWRSGRVTQDHGHGFFLNSPVQDVIAERTILTFLLQYAAENDRWLGFKTGAEAQSVDDYIAAAKAYRSTDQYARALSKSLDREMIKLGLHQDRIAVFPTEAFVKFVQERARR